MIYLLTFLAYAAGCGLSYLMLLTEHKSEGEALTIGDRALAISLSFLSWVIVIHRLITGWVKMVGVNGYWSRPVVTQVNEPEKDTVK